MNKVTLIAILILVVTIAVSQKSFSETANPDQEIMNSQANQLLSQDYTEETIIEETDEDNTEDTEADENNNDEEVLIEEDDNGTTTDN